MYVCVYMYTYTYIIYIYIYIYVHIYIYRLYIPYIYAYICNKIYLETGQGDIEALACVGQVIATFGQALSQVSRQGCCLTPASVVQCPGPEPLVGCFELDPRFVAGLWYGAWKPQEPCCLKGMSAQPLSVRLI